MKGDSLIGRDSRKSLEFLWPASLGVVGVVLGWWLIPAAIHLVGRGGQQETIEWALYMSLLVIFPPVVLFLSRGGERLSVARMSVVALSLLAGLAYVLLSPARIVGVALALAGGALTVFLMRLEAECRKSGAPVMTLPTLVAATFG